MYEVTIVMKDAKATKHTHDYVNIEETPLYLKCWEDEDFWTVIPAASVYYYEVKILD